MVFLSEVHRPPAAMSKVMPTARGCGGGCTGAEGQIKIPFTLAYSFKVPIQFPPGNAEVSTPACRLLSLAYMKLPRANCFTLFRQWVRCAFNFTLLRAVRSRAARRPMIAIVTSNSINVKARFVFTAFCLQLVIHP